MNTSFRDVSVGDLADWLAGQDSLSLWTVDGEEQISGALSLPCSGEELARVLRGLQKTLRIFWPEEAQVSDESSLESLASRENETLVFEMAWLENGQPGEHWIVAKDTLAEEARAAAIQN